MPFHRRTALHHFQEVAALDSLAPDEKTRSVTFNHAQFPGWLTDLVAAKGITRQQPPRP